jgi:hypothetical protein
MNGFFDTNLGRASLAALVVGLLGYAAWTIWANVGRSPLVSEFSDPIFIDADTGYAFHCKLTPTMTMPAICPDTGKAAGYPAELCFWTKDGHAKTDPTPVLLNIYRGISGPTFCPDCGRLVVAHNPLAVEGATPPPTKAEYYAARGQTPPN